MQALGATAMTFALVGCAATNPRVALAPEGFTDVPQGAVSIPPGSFEGLRGLPERSDVQVVVAAARGVVSAPEFRARMTRILDLVTSQGGTTSGREVVSHLLGLSSPSPLPTEYLVGGVNCPRSSEDWASTALEKTSSDSYPPLVVARTCFQPVVFEQWSHYTVEEMSCSINTVVRAWMHAIPAEPGGTTSLYSDSGRAGARSALAFYVAGAVAQCAFLEQHGYPLDDAQFEACVNLVGTRAFLRESCTPGWAGARFAGERGRAQASVTPAAFRRAPRRSCRRGCPRSGS